MLRRGPRYQCGGVRWRIYRVASGDSDSEGEEAFDSLWDSVHDSMERAEAELLDTGVVTAGSAPACVAAVVRDGEGIRRHVDKQATDLHNLVAWSQAPQPTGLRVPVHRPRLDRDSPIFNACVARPV